jgi:hypothetical protein
MRDRQADVQRANAAISSDQIALTAAQDAVSQAQLNMNTLNSQYQEKQADLATAKANAQTDYQDQVAALTQQLTDNYNSSQQELTLAYDKQKLAQDQVNQDDVELKSNIAEKPKSGATASYDDVNSEFRSMRLQLGIAMSECGCNPSKDPSSPKTGITRDESNCGLLEKASGTVSKSPLFDNDGAK